MKSEIPNPNVRNSRAKTQRRQAFLCDFATLREICSYRWLLISDLFQISDSGLRISDLICCLLFDFFSNVEVLARFPFARGLFPSRNARFHDSGRPGLFLALGHALLQ